MEDIPSLQIQSIYQLAFALAPAHPRGSAPNLKPMPWDNAKCLEADTKLQITLKGVLKGIIVEETSNRGHFEKINIFHLYNTSQPIGSQTSF